MKTWLHGLLTPLFCAILLGITPLMSGCDGSDSSSDSTNTGDNSGNTTNNTSTHETDFGDNNPDVIVCMGDSVTTGEELNAPSYPDRLAGLLGKTVENEGVGGTTSEDGVARVGSVLHHYHPGYLCIMYGINDLIHGVGYSGCIDNLNTMISAAQNNSTVPILATIPPRLRGGVYDSSHGRLNELIRALAEDEDVTLVDVEAEFDDEAESLLLDDGMHPNDEGTQIIAVAFWEKLR